MENGRIEYWRYEMKSKKFIAMVVITMLFCCTTAAMAYDRVAAASYATRNYNRSFMPLYNSEGFFINPAGDCANFVSQCLIAGNLTIEIPGSTGVYTNKYYSGVKTEQYAANLYTWLVNPVTGNFKRNGVLFPNYSNACPIQPWLTVGDVAFKWDYLSYVYNYTPFHSMFVHSIAGNNVIVAEHTPQTFHAGRLESMLPSNYLGDTIHFIGLRDAPVVKYLGIFSIANDTAIFEWVYDNDYDTDVIGYNSFATDSTTEYYRHTYSGLLPQIYTFPSATNIGMRYTGMDFAEGVRIKVIFDQTMKASPIQVTFGNAPDYNQIEFAAQPGYNNGWDKTLFERDTWYGEFKPDQNYTALQHSAEGPGCRFRIEALSNLNGDEMDVDNRLDKYTPGPAILPIPSQWNSFTFDPYRPVIHVSSNPTTFSSLQEIHSDHGLIPYGRTPANYPRIDPAEAIPSIALKVRFHDDEYYEDFVAAGMRIGSKVYSDTYVYFSYPSGISPANQVIYSKARIPYESTTNWPAPCRFYYRCDKPYSVPGSPIGVNYPGSYGIRCRIWDEAGNSSSLPSSLFYADPTFIQSATEDPLYSDQSWMNEYRLFYGYPAPTNRRIAVASSCDGNMYGAIRHEPGVATIDVSEHQTSGVLAASRTMMMPQLELPLCAMTREEYDKELAKYCSLHGNTSSTADSGYTEIQTLLSGSSDEYAAEKLNTARTTVQIEEEYSAQCVTALSRITSEYGRDAENASLAASGVDAEKIAQIKETAVREVQTRYAAEEARLGAARRARIFELHDQTNIRLQRRAWEVQQELQAKVREIASRITGDTIVDPDPAPEANAPAIAFAEGFAGSTQGILADICGTISDSNVMLYAAYYGDGANPTAWHLIGDTHIAPVSITANTDGSAPILARWFTAEMSRGEYSIKLVAVDRFGNRSEAQTTIITGSVIGEAGGIVTADVVRLTGRTGEAMPEYGRGVVLAEPIGLILDDTATFTYHYTDTQAEGCDESELRISWLDPITNQWIALPTTINAADNVATAAVKTLGYLALTAPTRNIISPNNSPEVNDVWQLPTASGIVTDVAGETVWTVTIPYWNGRNEIGDYVADGEYVLHESETSPVTHAVIVDNTAPLVSGLQLAVDAAGNLSVTGAVSDANLENFRVVLEGNYAGEEKTLATRYANCEGVLATGSVAGVAGQRVVIYARDLAGNEASASAELASAATVKELWCDQGWIAPEVESPDVPHSAEFSWELTGGAESAALRIENETGAVATVRDGLTVGAGMAAWLGIDNDSAAVPAGKYVYRIAGAAGDEISYLRYFTVPTGELANYVKAVGGAGEYCIADNRIAFVPADGTATSYLTEAGRFESLQDIAKDAEGNIWALDSGRCTLEKLSSAGATLLSCGGYGTNPGEYLDPVALASGEGAVYVLDGVSGRIDRRDSWGRLTNWNYAVAGAKALGVNGATLYAQANDSTIVEYALGGGIIEVKDLIANISIPTPDAMVRANVPIFGLACGKNFQDYRVEYGQGWNPDTWVTMIWSESPQNDDIEPNELISGDRTIEGNLATWATGLTEYDYSQYDPRCVDQGIDGPYTVRLTVRNQSGKEAQDSVKVTVGRVMSNTYAGTVISEDGLVVLVVPEQSLNRDFLIMSIAGTDLAPAVPADQALLGKVYEFRPAGTTFTRPCTMEWSVPASLLDADGDGVADYDTTSVGIYQYNPESRVWTGIGGSWQTSGGVTYVGADVMGLASGRGYYALLTDTMAPAAPVLQQAVSPTEAATAVLRGSAEPNSHIEISSNDTVAAKTTVAADGTFWAQVALAEGNNVFTAVAIDGLGQRSGASNSVTVTRQRKEPTVASTLTCLNANFTPLATAEVASNTVIGLELTGTDADANTRNRAGVSVTCGELTATVELIETGLNSGVYRGQWRVPYAAELADGTEIVFAAVADANCRATLAYRDTLAPRITALSIDGQAATRENFDDGGLGGWSAGADGRVENIARDDSGQDRVLRATATHTGGNFRLDWAGAPFNVDERQLLSFDYRMSPETKLNLLVKADGRWYDLLLTDDPKLKYYDVNMEELADLNGQADGAWHSVTVDLGAELERVTQSRTVEALCFADWDVQGFMKLVPGGANPVGAWLELDNVSISGAIRTPVTARAEVADASGVENIGWQLADNGVPAPEIAWAGAAYELPATENVGLSTLTATAKDARGNSASAVMPVFIDNAAPQIGEPRETHFSAHGTLRLPVFEIGSGVATSSVVLEIGGTQLTVSDTRLVYRDGELQVSGSGFAFANGADVSVRLVQLYDRAGNAAADLPKEWTLPWREERVLITEVDAQGDDFGNDGGSWIELYCAAGPVEISGASITDYEHNTDPGMPLANAPVTMQTGEYAVVHIGQGADETDDGSGGWTDWNSNGIRDLYYANGMSVRQIEDGVALLYNGVMDAVVWKQNPSVPVNEYEWDDFFTLVDEGAWEYSGGSFAQMVADLAGGSHIARKSPTLDTNRREDWTAIASGTPGTENVIVVDLMPPGTPTGVSATGGERSISVAWNAVADTDVAAYQVYRNDIAGPAATVAGLAWTDAGVTVGTTYRYSVAAVDASDNVGRASGSVGAAAFATPSAPVLLQPDPERVGVAELTLNGIAEQAGSVAINTAAGELAATADVPAGSGELLLGADELVNVYGCQYRVDEVQTAEGVRAVSYYTLATPPEMKMSTPFANRMGGWESADGWDDWRSDGILRNGAGHLLVYNYLQLQDYTLRLCVRPVSGNTAFWFGARNDNGYRITFDANGGPAKLQRTLYGAMTELGAWSGPAAGVWSEIAIAKKGTQLLLLQDGAAVLSVSDNQALPSWCNALYIDNRGGNAEYDYVEAFRGDLVGVVATRPLARVHTGAVTGVRVDGDAGSGTMQCEVEDSGTTAQPVTESGVTVAGDNYRVLATLWRGNDDGAAPVLRALHVDRAAGFSANVPLEVGDNQFTAAQTVNGTIYTGNTVSVTCVDVPALRITEIGLENGTLNGGYVEIENAGSEPVMLTDLRLGVGTADNESLGIYGDAGMPVGPLAPGSRALCHAARPDILSENEATGDLNGNGVLDVSYEDWLDLNVQQTLMLVWQGAIVDAVPMIGAGEQNAAEQQADLMRTLTSQGYWQGSRLAAGNTRLGRTALSRLEGTEGNQAVDWLLTRPTPGAANSALPVPAAGQVLINELALDPSAPWVEILGIVGECDAGALWLTDYDGEEIGPLTASPQALTAGGRLVAALPVDRLENADGLVAISGWQALDAVVWQMPGISISYDELEDYRTICDAGQWLGELVEKSQDAMLLGRIPDGQESNSAADWRVVLPTPGAVNARDEQGPQVTVSVTPAQFEPLGTQGETYCVITVTVQDPTDAQTRVAVTIRHPLGIPMATLQTATLLDNGPHVYTWDGIGGSYGSVIYGSWKVDVQASDLAGNSTTGNATVTVLQEQEPPTVWLEQNGPHVDGYIAGSTQFVLKATDNNPSWQPSVHYQVDDNWWRSATTQVSVQMPTTDGAHILRYYAQDGLGNRTGTIEVPFVRDSVSPTVEWGLDALQRLTLTATDGSGSGVETLSLAHEGGELCPYAGPVSFSTPGVYMERYQVSDRVGNTSEGEFEVEIVEQYDVAPPVCELLLDTTDASGAIAVPETLVSISATDAISGVASIEYAINGGSWQVYSAPFELQQAGVASGIATIAYRATDNAGNVGATQIRTITVKPALEVSAGLLNTPRVLAWWNGPANEQPSSKEAGLAALQAALDSAALDYRIVENVTDLTAALADYNTYLIIGDQVALDDIANSRLADQVALGKSLVSLGYEDINTPESTDRGWQNIFGVKVAGVLNGGATLTVNQGDLVEDTLTLTIEGKTKRITEVLSGDVLGMVTLTLTETDESRNGNGHGNGNGGGRQAAYPAVVANAWGLGKVLYAVSEYSKNAAALADILRNAIVWAAPAQEVAAPGGSVALRITVKNAVLPLTLRVNVETEVPQGGDVVAVYDDGEDRGNMVVWFDDLTSMESGEYRCVLRLPAELAGCVIRVDAAYLKGGSYRDAGSVFLRLE